MAALLAIITLPPQQLALCVGEDGHRELELLSAECCPSEAEHDSRDDFEAEADNCASDCIDTPVSAYAATRVLSPSANLLPDFHATPDVFAMLPADGSNVLVPAFLKQRDGPHTDPVRSSLIARTIVRRL
jgi:hypothetical protein